MGFSISVLYNHNVYQCRKLLLPNLNSYTKNFYKIIPSFVFWCFQNKSYKGANNYLSVVKIEEIPFWICQIWLSEVFWCFQGTSNEISGMKWVNGLIKSYKDDKPLYLGGSLPGNLQDRRERGQGSASPSPSVSWSKNVFSTLNWKTQNFRKTFSCE